MTTEAGALAEVSRIQTAGIRRYVDGDWACAEQLWIEVMRIQDLAARALGLPRDVRYLRSGSWTNGIGHVALLDLFVKRRLLGLDDRRYVVWEDPAYVANNFYLDLWREHLDFVSQPPPGAMLLQDYPTVLELYGCWHPFMDVYAEVVKRWGDRAPLLRLSPELIERGAREFEKLGVPRSSWFVAMHVRENGMCSGTADDLSSVRNASIEDYAGAVSCVAAAGGHVIWLGKRPPSRRLAGLTVPDAWSDWFDIFLLARSRFLVGTNSGPCWVSGTFGVPALLTNWAPTSVRYGYPNSEILPRRMCAPNGGAPPAGAEAHRNIESARRLAELGLAMTSNTPQEIESATSRFVERWCP